MLQSKQPLYKGSTSSSQSWKDLGDHGASSRCIINVWWMGSMHKKVDILQAFIIHSKLLTAYERRHYSVWVGKIVWSHRGLWAFFIRKKYNTFTRWLLILAVTDEPLCKNLLRSELTVIFILVNKLLAKQIKLNFYYWNYVLSVV